jgi:hypothetical protein
MKKSMQADTLTLYGVLYKAYKWKNSLGDPLSTAEQCLLTSWIEMSPTNTVLAGRLTAKQSTNGPETIDWFLERQRIGYYELVIRRYFKDIHPEKIARDHEIIWIMTEHLLTEVEGPNMKELEQWAQSSIVHKSIYERFRAEHQFKKESEEQYQRRADASWRNFEREYHKPFSLFKVRLIRLYKRLFSSVARK